MGFLVLCLGQMLATRRCGAAYLILKNGTEAGCVLSNGLLVVIQSNLRVETGSLASASGSEKGGHPQNQMIQCTTVVGDNACRRRVAQNGLAR